MAEKLKHARTMKRRKALARAMRRAVKQFNRIVRGKVTR